MSQALGSFLGSIHAKSIDLTTVAQDSTLETFVDSFNHFTHSGYVKILDTRALPWTTNTFINTDAINPLENGSEIHVYGLLQQDDTVEKIITLELHYGAKDQSYWVNSGIIIPTVTIPASSANIYFSFRFTTAAPKCRLVLKRTDNPYTAGIQVLLYVIQRHGFPEIL